MKSSRLDLSNYMAQHTSIVKSNQQYVLPNFIFTPKTGKYFLRQVFWSYCVNITPCATIPPLPERDNISEL